ncbi:MAG: M20/M25/M40 family metallo-hydrolase [Bacteroidetes bacterium]|nr:MAG: M20/M25/M40 family metallo-hydrolase [Bacteroidota bacterium]
MTDLSIYRDFKKLRNLTTMRKLFFVVISITLFGCTNSTYSKRLNPNLMTTSELLQILSSDSLKGRFPGTVGFEKAADFVESYMKNLGIKPLINRSYRDTLSVFDVKSYNVVGILESRKPINDYILLGAHLDHLKKSNSQTDSIYNGANDNASGVVAVLQIAKELKKYKFDKNVIISVFTGEESGRFGSKHLAKRLKNNKIKLSYVINIDMIGVPLTRSPKSVSMSGYYISDFAEVSNALLKEAFVLHSDGYIDDLLMFGRSDNASFYTEYNIPSHTISTYDGDNYKYYHTVQDDFSKLNIQNMDTIIAKTSKLIVRLLESNSVLTLKRLDEQESEFMRYLSPQYN